MCHLLLTERTARHLNLNFSSVIHGYQLPAISETSALMRSFGCLSQFWKCPQPQERQICQTHNETFLNVLILLSKTFLLTYKNDLLFMIKNKPVGFTVRKGQSDLLLGDHYYYYYSPNSPSARWGEQQINSETRWRWVSKMYVGRKIHSKVVKVQKSEYCTTGNIIHFYGLFSFNLKLLSERYN